MNADRAGRASKQGLEGLSPDAIVARLTCDNRESPGFPEYLGRQLSASVTIDARRVNEEIARSIARQAFGDVCHTHERQK